MRLGQKSFGRMQPVPSPLEKVAKAFPLWVAAACGLALVEPRLFTWFDGPLLVGGLGLIMLGMGMTLTLADFARVASQPAAAGAWPVLNAPSLEQPVTPE